MNTHPNSDLLSLKDILTTTCTTTIYQIWSDGQVMPIKRSLIVEGRFYIFDKGEVMNQLTCLGWLSYAFSRPFQLRKNRITI